jgi:hypothetical protein
LIAIARWRKAEIANDPTKVLLLDQPQKVWSRLIAANKIEETKRKAKKVVIDPEKLVEQFHLLNEPDRATVISDVMQNFDVGDVMQVIDGCCTDDALTVIADNIYRQQKRSVLVRQDETPKGVANILRHECAWSKDQVREVIGALEDALNEMPDSVVPTTPKGRAP